MKMDRPLRYPVQITMIHAGKGKTNPSEGTHFVAENSEFMIGSYGNRQLKYWKIDGELVRENPHKLHVTNKDITVTAVFGAKKPKKIDAGKAIEEDISATSGIRVKGLHIEEASCTSERHNVSETKKQEGR